LHPGRSAAVLLAGDRAGGQELGFVGELHPLVASAWDLERAAVFSVDLGLLAHAATQGTVAFRAFAAVPPLRQDLAVIVPDAVAAADVLDAVRGSAGEMLEDVSVFDVYTGEQVGAGRRSLALALSFRAPEETLTDEDVAPARERIVAAIARLGGELRA
jgi:phenylalanyl-tRNA synthetase beta chain